MSRLAITSLLLAVAAALGEQPSVGIIQFTGDRCADCVRVNETLNGIQARYGASVALMVKQIPAAPSGEGQDPNLVEARALGVSVLPTLFINGKKLSGQIDDASLSRVIDLSLGKTLAERPVEIEPSHLPMLGEPGRPEVTVFSDFQCPSCSMIAPVLAELARRGEASIRFKHFPLSFHAKAPGAHKATLAAAQQGKFWEMHDKIFAVPSKLDFATFEHYAQELQLDIVHFRETAGSIEVTSTISRDLAEGERLGVAGTPSLFINGRQFLGAPTLEAIRAALQTLQQTNPTNIKTQPGEIFLSTSAKPSARLEWFFDAHSELTRAAAGAVREILDSRLSGLEIVARHLPMSFHPNAATTHQALTLAAEEDKFWPFLDAVLKEPSAPDNDRLKAIAMRVGINSVVFAEHLDRKSRADAVQRDVRRAQELDIRGVPTFVLNGKTLEGLPATASLPAAITEAQSIRVAEAGGLEAK